MRSTIIDRNFSEIRRIVYSGKTLIKSGTTELSNSDFLETDLKYHQDKLSFLGPDVLGDLVKNDKNLMIEEGLEGIEKRLLTLFPTVVNDSESTENSISYFSTYTDKMGDEILCVLIPEDITEVDFYESEEGDTKAMSVFFEDSEIEFSKALFLVIGSNVSDPNLSYISYRKDKNGNRIMSDYVLRNDSLVSNYKGYHEECGFMYSGISSSIFGTTKVSNRPIYNLISSFQNESWNRCKRYSIGDKAKLGDEEYESIEPNNIGNHPYYSRYWIKSGIVGA